MTTSKEMISKIRSIFMPLLLAGLSLSMLTACGAPLAGDVASASNQFATITSSAASSITSLSANSTTPSNLSVTPTVSQVSANATVLISASNGVAPYTFTLLSGSGTISQITASVVNFAPAGVVGNSQIVVKDATGTSVTVSITAQ